MMMSMTSHATTVSLPEKTKDASHTSSRLHMGRRLHIFFILQATLLNQLQLKNCLDTIVGVVESGGT
jgi:hypothetical protein